MVSIDECEKFSKAIYINSEFVNNYQFSVHIQIVKLISTDLSIQIMELFTWWKSSNKFDK